MTYTPIVSWNGQLFERQLTRALDEIDTGALSVESFGAVGDGVTDDTAAINAALAASAADRGKTVMFTGDYAISSRITVPADAQTRIGRRAVMRPVSGSGVTDAVLFDEGNAPGWREWPTLAGFSGVAAEVRCALAHIYIPQFNTCGTCWKFSTDNSTGKVLDTVGVFDAISTCDVACEFNTAGSGDVMQGCGIRGNFITVTTDGVIFTGVNGAFHDGLFMDVLAVDFTTAVAGGSLLDNQLPSDAVARFRLTVRSWLGGDGFSAGSPTQLVKGRFDDGILDIANTRTLTQVNLGNNLWRAGRYRIQKARPVGSLYALQETTPNSATFNGGNMIERDWFIVRATLGTDILNNASRAFYFYHIAADANYRPWIVIPQEGNAGFILDAVQDESLTDAGRVRIEIRNVSGATIAAGGTKTFAVFRV